MDDKAHIPADAQKAATQCPICEKYTEHVKTFTCKKCRKPDLCLEHMDPEHKTCSGCAMEGRMRLQNEIARQIKSIKGLLGLLQFVFVAAAILFASKRLVYDHLPEFLKESIFLEYSLVWGIISICGMVLCYSFLLLQKQQLTGIGDKVHNQKIQTRYINR